MFTRRDTTSQRSPLADIKPIDRSKDAGPGLPPRAEARSFEPSAFPPPTKPSPATAPSGHGKASFTTGSIIGNDLTIMGQGLRIVTRGTLQVDGRIEGDVVGHEVIIGDRGHVTGIVSGESVVVRGAVSGTIRAMSVVLQSGAKVEGDVHHQKLAVEQGAQLDGRVRRPQDISELRPDLGLAGNGAMS
jgi:cytoskeletal protein CcmA (bactofilin family)